MRYLARHWRGEHGLGTALWINGLGLSAALGLVLLSALDPLLAWALAHRSPQQLVALAGSGALVLTLVLGWQLIGAWRSTARARRLYRTRLFPGLARLLVLASAALWLAGAALAAPALTALVAAGLAPEANHFALTAPRSGVLRLEGALQGAAVTLALEQLRADPIGRLELTSETGILAAAQRLAEEVRRRRLPVDLVGPCAGPCVLVLLAAPAVTAGPTALIELRRPAPPLRQERAWLAPATLIDLDAVLAEAGVQGWARERVAQGGAWRPRLGEAVAIGLVDHLLLAGGPTDALAFCLTRPAACPGAESALPVRRASPAELERVLEAEALFRRDPGNARRRHLAWLEARGRDGVAEAQRALSAMIPGGIGWLRAAARADPEAAVMLLEGHGERVLADAALLALAESRRGDSRGAAEVLLALLSDPEAPEALELWRAAAAAGHPRAQRALALSALDAGERVRLLAAAAEQGDPVARRELAPLLLTGTGLSADPGRALAWLREAAAAGDAGAMLALGRAHAEGQAGPADGAAARHWLEAAEGRGESAATPLLARLLRSGGPGLEPDPAAAMARFARLGAEGEAAAQAEAARLFAQGVAAPDPAQALGWLTALAEAGEPRLAAAVAQCHWAGIGTPRDPVRAARWLGRAAEAGDAASMVRLAGLLLAGTGVAADAAAAADWYRRGAERGRADAAHALALMLAEGRGLSRNPVDAAAWMAVAAARGHPDAGRQSALLLGRLQGVDRRDAAARARQLLAGAPLDEGRERP